VTAFEVERLSPPSARPGCGWKQHAAAAILFAAVLVLVFYRAIFLGDVLASVDLLTKELPWRAVLPAGVNITNFTTTDVPATFYPWKYFVHEELRAGRFPLWCTRLACGYPLAGEGMTKLFGLTTLFLWLAPPPVASWLTFATQLLIGMTGLYALLLALEARWPAAVFGGLVFGLNSAMFQHLEFEHVIGGLVFLPWICWALWRASGPAETRRRFLGLAGLFFGLCILNGSLQSGLTVWLSAAGFAAVTAWRRDRARSWRSAPAAIAAFSLLGLLVAAVSLAPNLELYALNVRPRFSQIGWTDMLWKRPVALLAWLAAQFDADALGSVGSFDLMRGLGRVGIPSSAACRTDLRIYCGLTAAVLALLGLRGRSDARAMALTLIAVPVGVVVLTPVFLLVYFRALAACACGIAVLAALGLQRVLDQDRLWARDLRKVFLGLAALAASALIVGAGVTLKRAPLTRTVEQIGSRGTTVYKTDPEWQHQKAQETVRNFSLGGRAVLRFCLLALALAVLLKLGPRRAALAALLCAALNTGDLIEVAWRTLPCVPARFDFPPTPALEFLQRQPGLFRVVSRWDPATETLTARQNMLMVYGLDDPRVYESLFPKNPLLEASDWNALGVRFLIVPPHAVAPAAPWRRVYSGEVDIYENPDAVPRVTFSRKLAPLSEEPAALRVDQYVSGHIVVRADTPQPGWLIVRERLYPGWQAFVNGQRAELQEAQGLWQAVALPGGTARVELFYRPLSVRAGLAGTCLGLLAVAALWPRRSIASLAARHPVC